MTNTLAAAYLIGIPIAWLLFGFRQPDARDGTSYFFMGLVWPLLVASTLAALVLWGAMFLIKGGAR